MKIMFFCVDKKNMIKHLFYFPLYIKTLTRVQLYPLVQQRLSIALLKFIKIAFLSIILIV